MLHPAMRRTIFPVLGLAGLLAYSATGDAQQVVHVATTAALEQAVRLADHSGGRTTIVIARGTYRLDDTLDITAPDVTLAGAGDRPTEVTLEGDAMSRTARIGNLIRVSGSHFELRNITLQHSRWHLIQIAGEDDAQAPILRDCILKDAYEQMVKVSDDPHHPNATSNGGLVEHCTFEYTASLGPEYYIGGIDAHGAKHWTVRDNIFRNIASPGKAVAEFAIHFWDGSADNLIEDNVIVNCDRGIGFGLHGKPNQGGTIRDNMIFHAPGHGAFADVGIALVDSPGSKVLHNTALLESAYPRAIEYRFPSTHGVDIEYNLTNRAITSRNGATGLVLHNLTDALASWFVDPVSGDLNLADPAATAEGTGAQSRFTSR